MKKSLVDTPSNVANLDNKMSMLDNRALKISLSFPPKASKVLYDRFVLAVMLSNPWISVLGEVSFCMRTLPNAKETEQGVTIILRKNWIYTEQPL